MGTMQVMSCSQGLPSPTHMEVLHMKHNKEKYLNNPFKKRKGSLWDAGQKGETEPGWVGKSRCHRSSSSLAGTLALRTRAPLSVTSRDRRLELEHMCRKELRGSLHKA